MATEKRLIDANAYPCQNCYISYCYKDCKKFNEWLNNTVDAVEVVRCKDCRMYEENRESRTTFCRRELNYLYAKPDGHCSYGERKTYE